MNVRNVFLTDRFISFIHAFFCVYFSALLQACVPYNQHVWFNIYSLEDPWSNERRVCDKWLVSFRRVIAPYYHSDPCACFSSAGLPPCWRQRTTSSSDTEGHYRICPSWFLSGNGAVMGVKLNIGIVDYSFIVDNFYQSFRVQVAFFFAIFIFQFFSFFSLLWVDVYFMMHMLL